MEWISVKDRLPELIHMDHVSYSDRCLVYDEVEKIQQAALFLVKGQNEWYVQFNMTSDYELSCVTHWMYLPEKPKE